MTETSHVRFVETGRPRFKAVPLEWPIEVEGRGTIYTVHVHRLTVGEIADWQEAIKGQPDDARVRLPLIRYEDGTTVPDSVVDAMDDDDKAKLDEEAEPFLPRRFRNSPDIGSPPSNGDPTEPSSAG